MTSGPWHWLGSRFMAAMSACYLQLVAERQELETRWNKMNKWKNSHETRWSKRQIEAGTGNWKSTPACSWWLSQREAAAEENSGRGGQESTTDVLAAPQKSMELGFDGEPGHVAIVAIISACLTYLKIENGWSTCRLVRMFSDCMEEKLTPSRANTSRTSSPSCKSCDVLCCDCLGRTLAQSQHHFANRCQQLVYLSRIEWSRCIYDVD